MELTNEQKQLKEACKRYETKFGEKYGITVGQHKTITEALKEINWCLANNIPQPDPEYDENSIY